MRSKSLYAHINNVELRTLDGKIIIPFQGLDTAVPVPGGRFVECMIKPGQTALTIPLQKLARDEETKLYVSNQCAGTFPAVRSHPDISDINIEEKSFNLELLDDGGTLALFGKVTNLRDEDFQTLVDGDYRSVGTMLQMGREWTFTSPDAIFTPAHVSILILANGHPGIRKSIQILQQHQDVIRLLENLNLVTSPIEEERKLVFSVTGNPHNQGLMKANRELKLEQEKLDGIQDIIRSIEIVDADGNSCRRLLSIHGIQIQGKGLVVMLQRVCGFIDMSNFHEIKLTVSGVCLRKTSGSFSPYDDGRRFQIHIDYDTGKGVFTV